MALTESELWQLRSFRRAASQVRNASIIDRGETIHIKAAPGKPGFVDIFVQLLSEEPFRSLALAIRLVHQQREPANFFRVCNLLSRLGDDDVRGRVASIRREYKEALADSTNEVSVDDDQHPRRFTAKEVFEHWLYGVTFHQDSDRQTVVGRLASTGARFQLSVQSTALQLAGRILDLDDVVADLLEEPRVPRIRAQENP